MDKRQRLILAILGGLLAVAITVLTVLLATRSPNTVISEFQAPPFEESALVGVPEEVLARADFHTIDVKGNYTFAICGAPEYSDGQLFPYFASHGENEVWLLLKVYGADGTELGKSGLIRPGECLGSIALSEPPVGETVSVKVLSYEPDTYFSRGSATVNLRPTPHP